MKEKHVESKQDLEFLRSIAESYARRNPNSAFLADYLALIERLTKRIHEYGKK